MAKTKSKNLANGESPPISTFSVIFTVRSVGELHE